MSAALPICLVVDDSRVVRKVARRILEAHGYEMVEAENGQIAVELFQRALDWNMPVMNGLAFLKALRAEFGPVGPTVIFCTTQNEVEQMDAALENGAQGYIMKPFDEAILIGKFAQIGLM